MRQDLVVGVRKSNIVSGRSICRQCSLIKNSLPLSRIYCTVKGEKNLAANIPDKARKLYEKARAGVVGLHLAELSILYKKLPLSEMKCRQSILSFSRRQRLLKYLSLSFHVQVSGNICNIRILVLRLLLFSN